MIGPTTWSKATMAENTKPARPLFRMGSMSQHLPIPVLGWIYGANDSPADGGGAEVTAARHNGGIEFWTGFGPGLGRPVAMATKPPAASGSEILLAYLKPLPKGLYTSDQGVIRYRRSLDDGISYNGETCTGHNSNVYGLTATYDEISDSFIIAFTQDAPPAHKYEMAVLTLPATGSKAQGAVTFLGVSSPHGPGIACGGSPRESNCLLAYETADTTGVLGWLMLNINADTGAAAVTSSHAQGEVLFDSPSVIFAPEDSTFRLVTANSSSAIYSYSLPALSGTSWSGTGDVYNNGSASISSGVLSTRLVSGSWRTSGWFIKHW